MSVTSTIQRVQEGVCRRLAPKFSSIALPLTDATRNATRSNLRPIEWTEPMDQIVPLDVDKGDNMHFDVPYAWNAPLDQVGVESIQIDPSLRTMTDPLASTAPGQSVITVPEQLAEASRKVLIYFSRTLDIPETPNNSEEDPVDMEFTTKELGASN
jgi:hypothetical protein